MKVEVHPDLWKDGITIEEASELNIETYSNEELQLLIAELPSSAEFNKSDRIDSSQFTEKGIRKILICLSIEQGKVVAIGMDDNGFATYDLDQVFDCLLITDKFDCDNPMKKLRFNPNDMEPIKRVYKESKSLSDWLKIPHWTIDQFICLLIGRAPDYFNIYKSHLDQMPYVPKEEYNRSKDSYLDIDWQIQPKFKALTETGILREVETSATTTEKYYPANDLLYWSNKFGIDLPDYMSELLSDSSNEVDGEDELLSDQQYMKQDHPFFSNELAIAVECWQELFKDGSFESRFTPKQAIETWLEKKYPSPTYSNKLRQRVATVVNPTAYKRK